MSEQDQLIGRMPPAEVIAQAAIDRLCSESYRSKIMGIGRELLMGIAQRLITPGTNRTQVIAWLRQQHDLDFDDVTFFRFAQRFEETYKTMRGERAASLIVADLDVDDEQVGRLAEFNRRRAMELIAAELVTTKSPADLDTKRLGMILGGIRGYDQTVLARDEHALHVELVRQRNTAQLQAAHNQQKIDRALERIRELEKRVAQYQSAQQRGRSVDPAVWDALRRELIALAEPLEAPPAQPPEADPADAPETTETAAALSASNGV